ncbi:MAG: T9SS type A sorting domain-containing protein, partial [Bacteroidales bacterium]|nr:T9SS type A sorting domain-containing protein [Bacteroidales bacterium]
GKDGNYSERVFYEGADTVTFFVVNYTDMQEIAFDAEDISIFPNPAQTQFTVTHTENATVTLYNLLGQKVRQLPGKEENTIICTEDLPQGIYLLKIEKENAVITKKVQIIR